MAKSMTKSQIADHVAQKAGLTKKAAVQLLDDFAALAYREAKNVFVVPGIGKLVLANRKARMGRNPQTGEAIKIPAKRVVKFRVSKAAKDAILGKKYLTPGRESHMRSALRLYTRRAGSLRGAGPSHYQSVEKAVSIVLALFTPSTDENTSRAFACCGLADDLLEHPD
jgi:DNA-binding protein HU-beta